MARTAQPTRFKAKLSRPAEGGDWTFLRLPQEASKELPTRNMVSVEGTMNGIAFAATLQPDSEGGHWLKVEPAWSQAANAQPGSDVEFEICPAKVEPEPEVPDDLREALSAAPAALAVWIDTTPIARRDWITWMAQVKRAETRIIRIEKMIDMLSKGKRRVCCFDRSGLASKAFCCPVAADGSHDG
ncbi:MAG: YdeI/OmpD-associated family protein [Fimbriimonas sp.]|nr:YdeI/OmpD-associated family protein [Fimbriimonas sp.]